MMTREFQEYIQLFRPVYKKGDTLIPDTTQDMVNFETNLDVATGKDVIFWDDIIAVFSNALYISNGLKPIPFLKDHNALNIEPLRFQTVPGVVLDVVLDGDCHAPSNNISNTSTSIEVSIQNPTSTTAPDHINTQNETKSTPQSSHTATDDIPNHSHNHPHQPKSSITYESETARNEIVDAHLDLGRMYEKGIGFPQDYSKAMEWYLLAANQLNPTAQNIIGTFYRYGRGVTQNFSIAMEWFLKAAEQGHPGAQYNIGSMYHHGTGVEKSYTRAIDWYLKAAVQGDASAQNSLGEIYYHGHGVEKDYMKAFEMFLYGAEQGNPSAQFNLGEMFFKGQGVPQNRDTAKGWYQKAREQGHNAAMNRIEEIKRL